MSFVNYLGSNSKSKPIKSTKKHSGEYGRFDVFCACMCVCSPCGAHELDKTCIRKLALTSHHVSGGGGDRGSVSGPRTLVVVTGPCELSLVMCTLVGALSLCLSMCVKGVSKWLHTPCALLS